MTKCNALYLVQALDAFAHGCTRFDMNHKGVHIAPRPNVTSLSLAKMSSPAREGREMASGSHAMSSRDEGDSKRMSMLYVGGEAVVL